jgi:hypothetical protein
MTNDLEDYQNATTWHDKVRIISLYHYGQVASRDVWLIADTAKYFGLSNSTIAENLQIAKKLSELKMIGSRNKALKRLRGII